MDSSFSSKSKRLAKHNQRSSLNRKKTELDFFQKRKNSSSDLHLPCIEHSVGVQNLTGYQNRSRVCCFVLI